MATTALFCALTARGAQPSPSPGLISGVVQNGWTSAPIVRAAVTLATGLGEPLEALTYTDSRGAFAFLGVPGGKYFLHADMQGYQRAAFGRTNLDQPPVPLILRAGESRQNIILKMLPLGSLTGLVTDQDGDPLPRAEVHLLHTDYARGKLHWASFGQATSDEHGIYRLSFVHPGKYRVMALREGGPGMVVQSDVTNGETLPELAIGAQFYPNAESVDEAATLTLAPGNEIKGIDFSLPLERRYKVSGTVNGTSGASPRNFVSVMLMPVGSVGEWRQMGAGAGPPEFRFNIENVAPGSYMLTAFEDNGDHTSRASQQIEISADQIVDVMLVPGTPLTGKLSLEGAGLSGEGPYRVELIPGDSLPHPGGNPEAEVKPDGSFEIPNVVPGIWDIGVRPMPRGSFIKSMLLGRQDVLTEEMSLGSGKREEMQIVLSANGGVVSGTVKPPLGPSPVSTAHRVVLLAPAGRSSDVLSFYKVTASNDDGSFEFSTVTPGDYRVLAFDEMERGEWRDPDFMKPYLDQVKVVKVGDGARLTQEAPLFVRGVEP